MVLSKSGNTLHRLLLLLALLMAVPGYAQYTDFRIIEELKGGEPMPRAILWNQKKRTALIHYKDEHMIVHDGFHLDKDWLVKEIRRESIVFGNNLEKRFIELYLDPAKRPNRVHHNWSFYGLPITIWEAMELLADGFNKNVVMHSLCGGAVTPRIHGQSMMEMVNRVIPECHRPRMEGDTLYVFPVETPGESWTNILRRTRRYNYKGLTIRYPDLAEKGTVRYAGEDIQYVLRVISLGGKTPITFPKDLHFSVYACYKNVPFSRILTDIVYSNQCVIVEREWGLEVVPWLIRADRSTSEQRVFASLQKKVPENTYTADPEKIDQVTGSGPYPPPLLADPLFVPSIVRVQCASISHKMGLHPVVIQPGYVDKGYNKKPTEVNYKQLNLPEMPSSKGK